MQQGDGLIMVADKDTGEAKYFSKRLMDPVTGLAYKDHCAQYLLVQFA